MQTKQVYHILLPGGLSLTCQADDLVLEALLIQARPFTNQNHTQTEEF